MHAADIVSDGGQTLSNYNRMAALKAQTNFANANERSWSRRLMSVVYGRF